MTIESEIKSINPNKLQISVGLSIIWTILFFWIYLGNYKTNVDRDILDINNQIDKLEQNVNSNTENVYLIQSTLSRIDERTARIDLQVQELAKKNQ